VFVQGASGTLLIVHTTQLERPAMDLGRTKMSKPLSPHFLKELHMTGMATLKA
jgi:hypothetical protein